jgi:hypothetical protein
MPLFPCDPQALINSAVCFDKCIPPGAQREVALYLLCQWSNAASAPTPVPPPTYPCGVPSNTIQISGAGIPEINNQYTYGTDGYWRTSDYSWQIYFNGSTWAIIDELLGNTYYSTPLASFPCVWTLGPYGTNPAPTGLYIPDSP